MLNRERSNARDPTTRYSGRDDAATDHAIFPVEDETIKRRKFQVKLFCAAWLYLVAVRRRHYNTLWQSATDSAAIHHCCCEPELWSPNPVAAVCVACQGALFYRSTGDHSDFTTMAQSVYFACVTCTTIGYGDMSPTTPVGRNVLVLYSLVGIGLWGNAVRELGELLLTASEAPA